MRIKYNYENGVLTIYLIGELDEHYAKGVKEYVDNLCDSKNPLNKVIFNFSEVKFMDSTGIGILLGRYKRLKKMSISCFIDAPQVSVEKVLELSGIYKIMPKL